jgi:hypothetical protein
MRGKFENEGQSKQAPDRRQVVVAQNLCRLMDAGSCMDKRRKKDAAGCSTGKMQRDGGARHQRQAESSTGQIEALGDVVSQS